MAGWVGAGWVDRCMCMCVGGCGGGGGCVGVCVGVSRWVAGWVGGWMVIGRGYVCVTCVHACTCSTSHALIP